jgi:hypothetical protein
MTRNCLGEWMMKIQLISISHSLCLSCVFFLGAHLQLLLEKKHLLLSDSAIISQRFFSFYCYRCVSFFFLPFSSVW